MRIRVLSYNVMMLPGSGKLDRARDITRAILSESPRFDILCFQEVFDEDIREFFKTELQAQFPHQVPKCDDGDLFQEDSGLFFASGVPIAQNGEAWGFEEFETSGPIYRTDYWADKGIFGTRLEVVEGDRRSHLCVFNTHLQSDPGAVGQYRKVRSGQLKQVSRFISKALHRLPHPEGSTGLLFGDFNVAGEREVKGKPIPAGEYLLMMKALGEVRDLFREKHPGSPGYTWDGSDNAQIPSNDHDQLRLDYLVAIDRPRPAGAAHEALELRRINCLSADVRKFGVDRNSRLSDHFGVEATLEV